MLIYNTAKEFIGIDEHDLKILGFSNLAQLQAEATDFADFFVRTPGHIHNFQHVHWIDLLSAADISEELKVIISVSSGSYMANLSLEILYLSNTPSSKAYAITLNNLRTLSTRESATISEELRSKPEPVHTMYVEEAAEEEMTEIEEPTYPQAEILPTEPLIVASEIADEEQYDLPLDVNFEEGVVVEEKKLPISEKIIPKIIDEKQDEDSDDGYHFDPRVASEELGLPLDLIEEFVQDFIAQAREFKGELFDSISQGDMENISKLSHRLKGVAANLRIENAFNLLSLINTSKDINTIESNLNKFYRIIEKLDAPVTTQPEVSDTSISEDIDVQDDDFVLDFKTENEEIEDEKVEVQHVIDNDDFILEFKDDEVEDVIVDKNENNLDDKKYSKNMIAEKIGLDDDVFEELFMDYITDAREVSTQIHQAISIRDFTSCKKSTALLKGMSESMHVQEISPHIECLMTSTDENEATEAINNIDDIIATISQ